MSRFVYQQNFTSDKHIKDIKNRLGHGNHVTGIIAGTGESSSDGKRTLQGIAPGVNLIILKVLDQNGSAPAAR